MCVCISPAMRTRASLTRTHTHLPSNVYTEKMAEERMCWNKKERVRPERVFARAYDCETMLGMTEKNHAPRSPLLKGEGTIQIWGHFTIPRSLSLSFSAHVQRRRTKWFYSAARGKKMSFQGRLYECAINNPASKCSTLCVICAVFYIVVTTRSSCVGGTKNGCRPVIHDSNLISGAVFAYTTSTYT